MSLLETLLLLFLVPAGVVGLRGEDPASGQFLGRQEARSLDCRHVTQAEAHALAPTRVPEPPARGGPLSETDALVCTRRFLREGARPARDEAVLSGLRGTVGEIAQVAGALGGEGTTWHVDAFYPEPRVAAKVAGAARTQLAEAGRRVSERVPLLAAGDLSVLADLPPERAYPLACARFFAEGSLSPGQAFLGLVLLDPRETQLHAGVCLDGAWRWLR
jgi:hypothetical protein